MLMDNGIRDLPIKKSIFQDKQEKILEKSQRIAW